VRLSDTAGLRPAQDRLEALGIERTRERLQQADLVLYLVDASLPLAPADGAALAELAGQPGLVVINKIDLPGSLCEAELPGITAWPLTRISAKTGQGIENLQEKIVALGLGGGLKVAGEVITQARHHEHLRQCLAYLDQARGLLGPYKNYENCENCAPEPPWELVALELGAAIHELGEITGEEVGEAILDRIFGQFCLGK
jgi:tRNA modification GTPase